MDQFLLANQCQQLVGNGFPNQRFTSLADANHLVVRWSLGKVGQQATAKRFGLSDVNQVAVGIQPTVDTR